MSLEITNEYDRIYTFCYFKIKNREVAEDITAETFLKFFETTDYLEKGKKLAFLYTIARNLCNDYFRKTKFTAENFEDLQISETFSEDLETSISVKSAVEKLNLEEQEIILLRFSCELGISEIAEYLGVSRFAVNRKIKSVLKQLKQDLQKEDFYG